jgi:hypothetical protein
MADEKDYKAPTEKQIEERDYANFLRVLNTAGDSSLIPLGRLFLLGAQAENRNPEKVDGLYKVYFRLMRYAEANKVEEVDSESGRKIEKKSLANMIESDFCDEARDSALSQSVQNLSAVLSQRKQINDSSLYHRCVANYDNFSGYAGFGRFFLETARECKTLGELRKKLAEKLPAE